jgi:antitoxin ChpS
MLVAPPAFLDQLALQAGVTVGIAINNGQLVVDPKPKPRYTLVQLLAESDYSTALSDEDREWASSTPIGREVL